MSLFKKLFGGGAASPDEESETELKHFVAHPSISDDEIFTINFKKNGGKFLYCENLQEVKSRFEDILEENDWFESNVACFEPSLYPILIENKLNYQTAKDAKFLFANCENLLAEDGAILFSSNQIKLYKPHQLPANIVILATTSQIIKNKGEGLTQINKRYEKNFPSNITTFNYFKEAKDENFLHYGSVAKNTYLLLLEDS